MKRISAVTGIVILVTLITSIAVGERGVKQVSPPEGTCLEGGAACQGCSANTCPELAQGQHFRYDGQANRTKCAWKIPLALPHCFSMVFYDYTIIGADGSEEGTCSQSNCAGTWTGNQPVCYTPDNG